MARGLRFCIDEVEGLYYPCSENKGTDQLRGYRKAELRLCFPTCKKPVLRRGSYNRTVHCLNFLMPYVSICCNHPMISGFPTRLDSDCTGKEAIFGYREKKRFHYIILDSKNKDAD